MNEQTKSRLSIDLDALERQLTDDRDHLAQRPASPARSSDPLAELARIVGQDDPFRAILSARKPTAASVSADTAADREFKQQPRYADEQPALDDPYFSSQHGYSRDLASEPVHGADPDYPDDAPFAYAPRSAAQNPSGDERPAPRATSDDIPGPDAGYTSETCVPQDNYDDRYAPSGQGATDRTAMDDTAGGDYDRYAYADPRDEANQADDQAYEDDASTVPPSAVQQRSRKGLVVVAAVLGLAVAGVGVALGLKTQGAKVADGGPITISADSAPTKVQPQNPGGVDIPNQSKQIYERVGEPDPAATKVVTREEQPVDVNQAVRRDVARIIVPGTMTLPPAADAPPAVSAAPADSGSGPVPSGAASVSLPQAPSATGPGLALGEPRRVKTVSVKPDGSIATDGNTTETKPAPESVAVPLPKPRTAQPAQVTPGPVTPNPAPPRAATSPPRATIAAPAPAATPPSDDSNSNRQNLSGAPVNIPGIAGTTNRPAATPATPPRQVATAPARDETASTASTGGFAVQLAAPATEKEARETFAGLQRRYPGDLGSFKPTIRKAEVSDKTIYRLRVGPMSREDATALCSRLQTSGGACFVARN